MQAMPKSDILLHVCMCDQAHAQEEEEGTNDVAAAAAKTLAELQDSDDHEGSS